MAGKIYTRTTWVDEVLAGAERFNILSNEGSSIEETVQIELDTTITTAGTPVNAENLNNIEEGLDNIDDKLVSLQKLLALDSAVEKTISSDAITVNQSLIKLQPNSGTSDDLKTISGLSAGNFVILRCSDPGTDTITIKHGTGNIQCPAGEDIKLSEGVVFGVSDGTNLYILGVDRRLVDSEGRLRYIVYQVFADDQDVEVGDSVGRIPIPKEIRDSTYDLVDVESWTPNPGTTNSIIVQLNNGSNDILSTRMYIDSGEENSKDAATAAVINASYKSLSGKKFIDVDVDQTSTTAAQGLYVKLAIEKV